MRALVERDALAKALSTVGRVIQKQPALEIMEHVLVGASGSRIMITAADMELRARFAVEATVEVPGIITLPAATLTEYVNRLPAGAGIAMELSEDGQRVALRSKRSRATLGTLNPAVFPQLAAVDADFGFEIEGRTLSRLLSSVEFAAWGDADRPMLSGILLQVTQTDAGPAIRTAAADGKRLGRAYAPCPRGADGLPDVILPKRAVVEIKRLADVAGEGVVEVCLSRSLIQCTGAGVVLTSKLIDAIYPDLDRVFPAGPDKIVVADGPEFLAALARSAVVADDKYRSSNFRFTPGLLEITSRSDKAGDIVETLDVEYQGPDFTLILNSKFARDILGALDCDTVRLACGEPGMPTLWSSTADASREYVLMPLRV